MASFPPWLSRQTRQSYWHWHRHGHAPALVQAFTGTGARMHWLWHGHGHAQAGRYGQGHRHGHGHRHAQAWAWAWACCSWHMPAAHCWRALPAHASRQPPMHSGTKRPPRLHAKALRAFTLKTIGLHSLGQARGKAFSLQLLRQIYPQSSKQLFQRHVWKLKWTYL